MCTGLQTNKCGFVIVNLKCIHFSSILMQLIQYSTWVALHNYVCIKSIIFLQKGNLTYAYTTNLFLKTIHFFQQCSQSTYLFYFIFYIYNNIYFSTWSCPLSTTFMLGYGLELVNNKGGKTVSLSQQKFFVLVKQFYNKCGICQQFLSSSC